MKFLKDTKPQLNKEMLPQVVNRIFSVCKVDKTFPLRGRMVEIDEDILVLKEKIRRQNGLFKQSKSLTHELNERMDILENRNLEMKERLLESLGSEL